MSLQSSAAFKTTSATPVAHMQPAALKPAAATNADQGLLITADPAMARSFRRELRDCGDGFTLFDVQPNIEKVLRNNDGAYRWITVDLDGTIAPSEAVRLARAAWPDARIAVLSYWWSERDALARDQADAVIHKPVRSYELETFLHAAPVANGRIAATGG